jgi:hypothetical protein
LLASWANQLKLLSQYLHQQEKMKTKKSEPWHLLILLLLQKWPKVLLPQLFQSSQSTVSHFLCELCLLVVSHIDAYYLQRCHHLLVCHGAVQLLVVIILCPLWGLVSRSATIAKTSVCTMGGILRFKSVRFIKV